MSFYYKYFPHLSALFFVKSLTVNPRGGAKPWYLYRRETSDYHACLTRFTHLSCSPQSHSLRTREAYTTRLMCIHKEQASLPVALYHLFNLSTFKHSDPQKRSQTCRVPGFQTSILAQDRKVSMSRTHRGHGKVGCFGFFLLKLRKKSSCCFAWEEDS